MARAHTPLAYPAMRSSSSLRSLKAFFAVPRSRRLLQQPRRLAVKVPMQEPLGHQAPNVRSLPRLTGKCSWNPRH